MAVMQCKLAGCLILMAGICLITALLLPTPTVLDCEFLEHSNATCWWDQGIDGPILGTSYILQVNETLELNGEVYKARSCETFGDRCSVNITTVTAYYCVAVVMRGPRSEATSVQRCFHGLETVKLYPPVLSQLSPVRGHPHCLELQWSLPPHFALSRWEVAEGHLRYQVWYMSKGQVEPQVLDEDLMRTVDSQKLDQSSAKWTVELCLFSAFTRYTMQIRYRYNLSQHWSDWSAALEAHTEEGAPSVAPHFWRQMDHPGPGAPRTVTLLWKVVLQLLPPDLANGVIVGINTSCGCEGSPTQASAGACGAVSPNATSCMLELPLQPCTCTLAMITSAGSSPPAYIRLPGATDPVGPPPENINVLPLDDFRLQVRWTAAGSQAASGYVVEWFAVTKSTPRNLHWQMLEREAHQTIITEGLQPKVRYIVSVRAQYGDLPGQEQVVEAYTRQGAPSTGPKLRIIELRSNSVTLHWEPIPVEQRNGFIRNYTLYWKEANGQAKESVVIAGDSQRHVLRELHGEYSIVLVASTDVGHTPGQPITVVVGQGDVSLLSILSCITFSVFTTFILLAILWHRERVRRHLCPKIPDPAKSSLSGWVPWMHWREDIKSPEMQVSIKACYPTPGLVTLEENEQQQPLVVIPMAQDEYSDNSAVAFTNVEGYMLPGDQGSAKCDMKFTIYSYANLSREENPDHSYPCLYESAYSPPPYLLFGNLPKDMDLSAFPPLLQILLQDFDTQSLVAKNSTLRRSVVHSYEGILTEKPPPSLLLQTS